MIAAMDKVDLISVSPGGEVGLDAVAEAGEWDDPKALWHLQEKMNAYSTYALDGQMAEEYPETVGKLVKITLSSVDSYPAHVTAFIDRLRPLIEGAGLGFEVRQIKLDKAA